MKNTFFNHYCAPCHGESGKGDGRYYSSELNPKPTDFTNVNYMKTLTDEQISLCITDGSIAIKKSNLCPPWGKTIPKEETDRLVNHIRSFTLQPKIEKKEESLVTQAVKNEIVDKHLSPILLVGGLLFILLTIFVVYKLRTKHIEKSI